MITDAQITIGEIVANDYRTAALFSKLGIDFCCKGYKTLEEVCSKKKLQTNQVIEELNQITLTSVTTDIDYTSWPIEELVDYIEKKHHSYVEEKTPVIREFLNKLCRVHGDRHPELYKINELFMLSAGDLASHMRKEELILFPFIRQMIKSKKDGSILPAPHFGTVQNPIEMMKHDHSAEGERFETISEITNGYLPPADACNTYRITFAMLEEFEKDLHTHIHLENNILFPGVIVLEGEFEA